ncbi:MAG: DNA-formamidopyrimidine glycosylase family protein [Chitinophagaceae bacterium]
MPEGPTLVILKESVLPFIGKKVLEARGNAKIDMTKLQRQKILDMRTWGKQFFICFEKTTVRIHFLMFGSYTIGEQTRPDKSVRLSLRFSKETIYFYTCSVKIVEGVLDTLYDWEADVMSDKWNPARARKKIKAMPDTMVCDALLDQQIFSGVGNIIKNELLYRIKLHPETFLGNIPSSKLTALITEARNYSFDFLK